MERLVVGEQLQHRLVGRGECRRVAGERSPAKRAFALAEERPDVGGHEPRELPSAHVAAQLGLSANRVAVVEDLGAGVLEPDHRLDMQRHRSAARSVNRSGSRSAYSCQSSNSTPSGRYDSGSWAEVWSVTMSTSRPRRSSSGSANAQLPTRPTESGAASRAWRRARDRRRRRGRWSTHRDTGRARGARGATRRRRRPARHLRSS